MKKLRTKVFLLMMLIAIIPLIILTSYSYNRYKNLTYQRMDEISSTLFDNAVKNANQILNSVKQSAGIFTFYTDGNDSIINEIKNFSDPEQEYSSYQIYEANKHIHFACQNIFFTQKYIYGIYIFTPSGVTLSHTSGQNGDLQLNYSPIDESWYQDTLSLKGNFYTSSLNMHNDMFTGTKPSVFFSQALYDVDTHKFLGVLLIDCSANVFDLSLSNTMPEITLLTLDNTKSNCVLYTNIDKLQIHYNKKYRQVKHADLDLAPLRLTAVFDYNTLFHEFNTTGILLIITGAICGFTVMIFSYFLALKIVQPIEHLSQKMSSQHGHSLTVSSKYLKRHDEIGTLYYEYNSMVENLNAAIKRDYQEKLATMNAQMKSMEAWINSHFLFNTLESINSMAELADNKPIAQMSISLGNMFRYSIKTQSEIVTIKNELNHVSDYVSIQQIRFNHRFSLITDIPKELLEQHVLKLILQPLVENALYHGLNYCTSGDTIIIKIRADVSHLHISVRDNGQGISAERLKEIQQLIMEEDHFTDIGRRKKQSIGLKNINSRIKLYYGQPYGLSVSSQLNEWTEISILLPLYKGASCIIQI